MSRDDEALDELELALEALATGRDDLVPADLRAHIEGDPALRDELARDRALHIDLGLALRDAPTPEVDLDAMVAAAMDAAPPVPSRRGLWLATGIGTLSTLGLGLAALGVVSLALVFALEWTETEYTWFVDGEQVWQSAAGGVSKVPLWVKLY